MFESERCRVALNATVITGRRYLPEWKRRENRKEERKEIRPNLDRLQPEIRQRSG